MRFFYRCGLFVGLLLLEAACTATSDRAAGESLDMPDAFTKECTLATADACPGRFCVSLKENLDNRTGLCTARCSADADCPSGACLAVKNEEIDANICFRTCESNADCPNGLTCIEDADSKRKICFVRTGKRGSPCNDASECTEPKAACAEFRGRRQCTGALDAPDIFERECAEPSSCPGGVCIFLKPNVQEKAGICSMACAADADCPGGACLVFGQEKLCASRCTDDADCSNGFVCRPSASSEAKACSVQSK